MLLSNLIESISIIILTIVRIKKKGLDNNVIIYKWGEIEVADVNTSMSMRVCVHI